MSDAPGRVVGDTVVVVVAPEAFDVDPPEPPPEHAVDVSPSATSATSPTATDDGVRRHLDTDRGG